MRRGKREPGQEERLIDDHAEDGEAGQTAIRRPARVVAGCARAGRKLRMMAELTTRKYAKVNGLKECSPILEMM